MSEPGADPASATSLGGTLKPAQAAVRGRWVFPNGGADRIAQEVARRYLERRFLWLQTRQVCRRCRAHGARALLAL